MCHIYDQSTCEGKYLLCSKCCFHVAGAPSYHYSSVEAPLNLTKHYRGQFIQDLQMHACATDHCKIVAV